MTAIRFDLGELERELGGEIADLVRDIAIELSNQIEIEAPTGATGDLRRSWGIVRVSDTAVVVASNMPYALFVQTGTRPHTPPLEPLLFWAHRVLGDRSAGYAVWQKIRQDGTDANPYLDRAMDNVVERFGR